MNSANLKGCLSICLALFLAISSILAQEVEEKGTLSLGLAYHRSNEELPILKATTRTRIDKRWRPVKGVYVNFFLGEESEEGFLGRMRSDEDGIAKIEIPGKFKDRLLADAQYTFLTTVTGDENFEDASEMLDIYKAKIEVTYLEDGDDKSITGRLLALDDSSWVEVPEVEIKFVVDRYFQDLSITDDYLETDEFGEASAEFQLNIPGDENGNIRVGAKIEDHELYGSLTFTEAKKWGTPTVPDESFNKRSLWATRDKTPIWLLGLANAIILSVWAVIFYLIFQLIKIRRLGKAH
jgi:hypothetical protein